MWNHDGSHQLNCERVREVLANTGDRRDTPGDLESAAAAHLETCAACLDAVVVAALEEKPPIGGSADFAARLAAKVVAKPVPARAGRHLGLAVRLVSLAIGLAALLALPLWVPHGWSGGAPVWLAVETLVAAEVGGIAAWVAFRGTNLIDSGMNVRRFHFW